MTRPELADALGLAVTTIARFERIGILKPAGKNERGWVLYHSHQLEELREAVRNRRTKSDINLERAEEGGPNLKGTREIVSEYKKKRGSLVDHFEADVAARVFKELDLKKHPADIVQELVIHPDIVKAIFVSWNELRGGLYIPQNIMNKINGLQLEGSWPSLTAEELLENLKKSAAAALPQCLRCKKEDRVLCKGCAETVYKR